MRGIGTRREASTIGRTMLLLGIFSAVVYIGIFGDTLSTIVGILVGAIGAIALLGRSAS